MKAVTGGCQVAHESRQANVGFPARKGLCQALQATDAYCQALQAGKCGVLCQVRLCQALQATDAYCQALQAGSCGRPLMHRMGPGRLLRQATDASHGSRQALAAGH